MANQGPTETCNPFLVEAGDDLLRVCPKEPCNETLLEIQFWRHEANGAGAKRQRHCAYHYVREPPRRQKHNGVLSFPQYVATYASGENFNKMVKKSLTNETAKKVVGKACDIYDPWLRRTDKSFHDLWCRLTRSCYIMTKPKVAIPDVKETGIWMRIVRDLRYRLNAIVIGLDNQDGERYELIGDFAPSENWSVFKIIEFFVTELLKAVYTDLRKTAEKDSSIDRASVESVATKLGETFLDKLAALHDCGVTIRTKQISQIRDEIGELLKDILVGELVAAYYGQQGEPNDSTIFASHDTLAPALIVSRPAPIYVELNAASQSSNAENPAVEGSAAVVDTIMAIANAVVLPNDIVSIPNNQDTADPESGLRIDTSDWSKICHMPYEYDGETKSCKECRIVLPNYRFVYSDSDFWELFSQDKCPRCASSYTEFGMAEFAFRFMHHQDSMFSRYGLMDDPTLEPSEQARKRHKGWYNREYKKRFGDFKRRNWCGIVENEQKAAYKSEIREKDKSEARVRETAKAAPS